MITDPETLRKTAAGHFVGPFFEIRETRMALVVATHATLCLAMLRSVLATRYVTPLREGGSLPAIVEADDLGLHVLKFHGAGQGPLALAAEVIAGEIGRVLGLPVPELVLVHLDEAFGRNEQDEEVRDLLRASVGLNLAMDYLPGSLMFDPAAGDRADAEFASRLVWFDSFVTNVDRTARNPNLLCWHKKLFPIDHGAALYFHHNWQNLEAAAVARFSPIREHVLLRWASELAAAHEAARPLLTRNALERILALAPDEWLLPAPGAETPGAKRTGYVEYFLRRLESNGFLEEAVEARAHLV